MDEDAADEYLYTNVLIVTCDAAHTIHQDGVLHVNAGKIASVGPASQLAPLLSRGIPAIDGGGRILMPGLVNAHCHAADCLFRGLIENLPLEAWLAQVMQVEKAVLTAGTSLLGAQLGYAELLLGGVTAVMDMYWFPEQNFAAAEKAGLRLAGGGIFFDGVGMDGVPDHERAERARTICREHRGSDRLLAGVAPHGTYTVAPDGLRAAWQVAAEENGFFHIHAAETRAEQETVRDRYGETVVRHLSHLGMLDGRTLLAHCVHVDEEEIGLIAASGAHVAHNPLSNLKLASGFAPVPRMLAAGINIALGTDGAISGNDIDMWLAMRLAATIHKAATGDATAVSPRQTLHMATLNGARAFGAGALFGSLEPGKEADFILVDRRAPHAMPMFDPINHLVFSAGRGDVRDVFVGGRQVVREKKLLTLDIEQIGRSLDGIRSSIAASGR
jgi:5-methylthioadenosine/S-adenosylhomocysteine deaminase